MDDLHDADAAPVTTAELVREGWKPNDDRGHSYIRRLADGRLLTVWPNTGGVELAWSSLIPGGHGVKVELVRLIESGCTLGRLRQLVAALEGKV